MGSMTHLGRGDKELEPLSNILPTHPQGVPGFLNHWDVFLE